MVIASLGGRIAARTTSERIDSPRWHCNPVAGRSDQTGSIIMGSFSVWHWMIVLAVAVLMFGRGKIPELMGDVAKGIKFFRQGMADDTSCDLK
jgi:sec-independent protein translocase protein TatA